MRIGELSRASGVPLPTVKYYLREGLLPGGRLTASNQATYDQRHLHRLRLIRTLRDVGGLGIEPIRKIVVAIDADDVSQHELFGVAQAALEDDRSPADAAPDARAARADVDRYLEGMGWRVRGEAPARQDLADALSALRRLGRDVSPEVFAPYARAADAMARWEVTSIPRDESRSVALERMVVGTIVFGRVFDALRRLAHEHHSAGRSRADRAARPRADQAS